MPIVNRPVAVFVVTFTEYERGYGQRKLDPIYFDNAKEAKEYADRYNQENNNANKVPDWYIMAEYRRIV
jgi:hypothetical protein